jgi:hypothetical protein
MQVPGSLATCAEQTGRKNRADEKTPASDETVYAQEAWICWFMRAIPRGSLGPVVVIAFIVVFIFRNYIHRLKTNAIKKCAGNGHTEMHILCFVVTRTKTDRGRTARGKRRCLFVIASLCDEVQARE